MTFDKEYFNIGYLDTLSYKDTSIHRRDPRIKVMVTFFFILTVISFPKYEITRLIPLFFFPMLLASLGNIRPGFILKKVIVVSPFAVLMGVFNPLIDTGVLYSIHGIGISGGWISFISVVIKFFLTASAALLLVATTSFPGICYALQKLRIPEIFVSQLLFMYRYIFVLMEETMKIVRAREMRSFGKKGRGVKIFVNIIGVLFLRTMERSERIYNAMLSRGYDERIVIGKKYELTSGDFLFTFFSLSAFYILRRYDFTSLAGRLITGG